MMMDIFLLKNLIIKIISFCYYGVIMYLFLKGVSQNLSKSKSEDLDDLDFDEMNDTWDELDGF